MRMFAKAITRGQHTPGQMNKLEAEYSQRLELLLKAGEILMWKFESVKLKLATLTYLTPDFFVLNKDAEVEFHETKGWMLDDAAVKIKVAAAMYPFRFVLVYKQTKKDGGGFRFEEVGG